MKSPIKHSDGHGVCLSYIKSLVPKGSPIWSYLFFSGELEFNLNNDSGGYPGGGGNGYGHPQIGSRSYGIGQTFPGDPTSWGGQGNDGAIKIYE